MRDHISDAKAGKNTLVVKIGLTKAKQYHTALIVSGFVSSLIYVILVFASTMQLFFILSIPLFRKHVVTAMHIDEPRDFDPLLKQLALSTFLFSILFAIGVIVGSVG
jgi:1,4-dihydroxy-2-naphthoate octaprenyltransferase